MAVFRVERTKDFTVMSNHHLRNKALSLKAKGLLSQMLSLPEDWDYTLAGLSHINRESVDAIRTAVWELEKAGYITRFQGRDNKGKMTSIVYTIYERPHISKSASSSALPLSGNPTSDKPISGKPSSENPTQRNIDITSIEKQNIDLSNIDSFTSEECHPSVLAALETKRKEEIIKNMYRKIIKENISYDYLLKELPYEHDRLDEILELLVETVCSTRRTIRVAGADCPAEVVRSRLLKLDMEHIKFVFDCLKENTTKIRNIKQYLLTTLYNAPTTIGNYYSALVQHDLYGG